ncbi:MAG: 2-phosphosulfolactate phosphatase [Thermoplasmata archaeon]|nr:2-phosphosulfolactate phosphatase [Thermoplasmata archaeon]
MDVRVLKGESGCQEAEGVAVVIDVFRATTTICCLLESNPKEIVVGRDFKDMADLVGSEDVECFSEIENPYNTHDNSPLGALTVPLENKTALLITRNGTVAFDLVRHCDRVFAAALMNVNAIVDFLKRLKPEDVALIAVGHMNRDEETIEDNLCAEIIHAYLDGRTVSESSMCGLLTERIRERRLDPESPQGFLVEIDLSICRATGISGVVPEIVYDDDKMRVIEATGQFGRGCHDK